jgi:hypothetical protein
VSPSIIERDTLSYFLINLARKRDGVCEETDSPNPLYMGLKELVCSGDLSVLRRIDEWEPIGKPYYPLILIDYYLLFHRLDFDMALSVYEWLRDSYERHPYTFDPDERCGLRVLEKLMCRYAEESVNCTWDSALREVAQEVERVQCPPNGWGATLKEIVLGHLLRDLDERLSFLNHTLAEIKKSLIVDEDAVKAYNLVLPKWGKEVIVFLEEASRNIRDMLQC